MVKTAAILRWAFVYWWVGWSGSFAWYRWGVLRGEHGGKAYLGPLQIVWGQR